jgi:hypothetical protein
MAPTTPRHDEDPADYEQLRDHLRRPPLEHPAPRQQRIAPIQPRVAPARRRTASQVSVVDWSVATGLAVARRLRGAPRSAMVPIHPRK